MYEKRILPNGVRLLAENVPGIRSVALGIWVHTGSRFEEEKKQGISHFLEHLLFKGTPGRSARQIAEELERVGGSLNAFTTKEYTCFYARVLVEHLELAINLLADMYFHSLLDSREIEKEKEVILEEIKMYEDSPDELVHDLFARTIWRGHPLGRAILGTEETVRRLNRDDLMNYYQNRYSGENTVVAVAGGIAQGTALDKLGEVFNGLRQAGEVKMGEPPVPRAEVYRQKKDVEQVQICLGTPGLAQEDERSYQLYVLNNVLGGGLSSRLFQKIREERALAYSVYSYNTSYKDGGIFTVYAATSPGRAREVVDLILKEVLEMKEKGISEEELAATKEQIRGNLLLNQESVNNRMSRLGKTEVCYNRVITVEEVLEKIGAVRREQVLDLTRELFLSDHFAFTSIGPEGSEIPFPDLLSGSGL